MSDTANPGLGVDAAGNPVVDPTKNVLNLVEAEGRRQDDLRLAAEKLSNVKHAHADEKIAMNAAHEKELRELEAKRLDAVRAVDVAANALREERADRAATALANQVTSTASTMRDLVATTASAAAQAAAAVTNPLAERIAVLEKGSYEGSGKSAVVDPALARMTEELAALRLSTAGKTGQGVGMEKLYGWFAAGAVLIFSVLRSAGKL